METPAAAGMDAASATERVVTCDLSFEVAEPAEVVVQIVAATSAGRVVVDRLAVGIDGSPSSSVSELRSGHGETMQVIQAERGQLTVSYRAEIDVEVQPGPPGKAAAADRDRDDQWAAYERQIYLRPSRYCPSDHLVGFAVAEFGAGLHSGSGVTAITSWIRERVGYVPGSSDVHDSAEDTLLTGMGTCRDFAHLGIALCRATGIPARFAAVYAPGLSPMEFHAVFEAFVGGRWYVYDATGLAPRQSLVRIATGRDAADTAFSAVNSGVATLEDVVVTATVGAHLPIDDHSQDVELS
jgi:transglutaminase-like putative cysteine protease